MGTVTHHERLAQADRLIANCLDRIARQREVITTDYEQGLPTDVAESMLRALEESLRALRSIGNTSSIGSTTRSGHDWQEPDHDLRPRRPTGHALRKL
jgi:hypothetical protein